MIRAGRLCNLHARAIHGLVGGEVEICLHIYI